MVKKQHEYSNDTMDDMRRFLKLLDKYNTQTEEKMKQIVSSCRVCVQSELQIPKWNISINHVDM